MTAYAQPEAAFWLKFGEKTDPVLFEQHIIEQDVARQTAHVNAGLHGPANPEVKFGLALDHTTGIVVRDVPIGAEL